MKGHAARRILAVAAAATAATTSFAIRPAAVLASGHDHEGGHAFLSVMTRNMDEGTDFGYVTAAAGQPQLLGPAIVQTFCEVVASNVEQRAARIAYEIAANQPDIVSLQEVAEWQSFVPLPCTAPTTIDAEGALLARLAARDARYHVVTQLDEFNSASIPGLPVSFLDRDVLLARDRHEDSLSISNVMAHHFGTLLTIPLAPGVNVTILRGWMSADVTSHERTVRIIGTHLESFFEPVQQAQALELVSGPGNTSMPVIVAGDLNTGPGSRQTKSYTFLTQIAGFTDTWTATRTNDPGFTDSFYTEDPLTPAVPSERIDLVLVRGIDFPSAPKDHLVGTEIPHPSDHAGVVARVTLRSDDGEED